jgi:HB1, ASXL, restriction endonuclease HTH domain
MVRGKPTYLWAAEVVLRKHKRPLRAPQLVSYAQEQGLFSGEMHSRTPQKSMQARLSLDILNKGERSVFVRTSEGKTAGYANRECPDDPAWSQNLACAYASCAGTGRSHGRPTATSVALCAALVRIGKVRSRSR